MKADDYLKILHNHIDIRKIPFSDRGSRILLYQYPDESKLFIKLAERLTRLEKDIDAYLKREPFIRDLSLLNKNGKELEFSVISSPYYLELNTEIGNFEIVFRDEQTLAFGLPPNQTCGIKFRVFPQYWRKTEFGGKFLSIHNIHYKTNGIIQENSITPFEGGYEVELILETGKDCTISLEILPAENITSVIEGFSFLRENARQRWLDWFSQVPEIDSKHIKMYAYAWWIMANNLISPRGEVIYEAMTPSKIGYVGLWLWDNAMHALAYRHVDPELARNQIRSMLAHQLPNGMVPDVVYDEGIVSTIDHPIFGEVTKPPILAWAALKLYEKDQDIKFLSEMYVPLARLNAWWFSMNDDDNDGMAQYNHPYSSGLDNSPLWDEGMPVESPDLNTYLCIQLDSLAEIASILNIDAEAAMWRRRSAALTNQMINHFWDPDAGVFWALKTHQPIKVVTPFNLYPLWTGQLPEEIRNKLLAHLTDPEMFWGEYKIPTVARNDPKYDPQTMWRGPIWANINYFFIEALHQIGEDQLAIELCENTLDLISAHDDIFEYYNAETGAPPSTAVNNFGWTAAVFIDLAIQANCKSKGKDNHEKSKRKQG